MIKKKLNKPEVNIRNKKATARKKKLTGSRRLKIKTHVRKRN